MTNPILHFEIPADDVQRAVKFYKKTMGWKIQQWPGMDYHVIHTKDKNTGIDGGLLGRKHKAQPFMNYIDVRSIELMHKAIIKAGGTVVLQKMEIGPGMGWISAFKDTEGQYPGTA